jgi:hypothetical protein
MGYSAPWSSEDCDAVQDVAPVFLDATLVV